MEQLLGRKDESSLRELGEIQTIYETEGGYDIDARIEKEFVAIGMELPALSRRFSLLSGGEQTRALITALFLKHGSFPVIDEPTNHLDMAGRDILGEYLADKQGFILVSHDRYFIDRCADHVIAIEKTGFTITHGGFCAWKSERDARLETERRKDVKLKKEIRLLRHSARQRRGWSARKERQKIGAYDKGFVGHKAAKQMKRAITIERRIEEKLNAKQDLLRDREQDRKLKLRVARDSPDVLLSIHDLTIGFGSRDIIRDFSLTLQTGERVALLGPNGSGKTTLLRAVFGELQPNEGVIYYRPYLTVERSYQEPLWQRGYLRDRLREQGVDETSFRSIMAAFGVTGHIFDRPLETFSQGELKKVDLCRSFLREAHLWLWDEPMNYIDLLSREQIEEVVLGYAPSMLFVEHDRRFVENIATRIVELDIPG
jgi:lincosamide and streptogramin A transport system ATP-binding/permease protein